MIKTLAIRALPAVYSLSVDLQLAVECLLSCLWVKEGNQYDGYLLKEDFSNGAPGMSNLASWNIRLKNSLLQNWPSLCSNCCIPLLYSNFSYAHFSPNTDLLYPISPQVQ